MLLRIQLNVHIAKLICIECMVVTALLECFDLEGSNNVAKWL